jgi:hypothetical protein
MRQTLIPALVSACFLITGCDRPELVAPEAEPVAFSTAPADGNGNKFVVTFDDTFLTDCGGETINLNITGWFQARAFTQPSSRNLELDIFHQIWTYTNTAGDTFVYPAVGPNRFSLDVKTGEQILEVSGRSGGAEGIIGRFVLNLDTFEVEFLAGQDLGSIDERACEALT